MPFFPSLASCGSLSGESGGNWWLAVAAPAPTLDALIFGWIEDSGLTSASHGWISRVAAAGLLHFGLCRFHGLRFLQVAMSPA
ncbi:unnamed protein product [Urochloa humidicola]